MQPDIDRLPGGLIVLDEANIVTAVNRTLCDWLGRAETELVGHAPESWMTGGSRIYYLGHVLPALRLHGHAEEMILTFTSAAGQPLPVLLSASSVAGDEPGYQLLLLPMQRRNLVEEQLQQARKAAEQATEEKTQALEQVQALARELEQRQEQLSEVNAKLELMATQDPLTGLANRRVYDRQVEAQLALFHRTRTPFALVLTDIDLFKRINDRFGHDAGDRVLKDVAQCLHQGLREIDTLVRMGGEEFALILPSTTAEQAIRVAERKRELVAQYGGRYGEVTMSFGITEACPDDTKSLLYGRADRALYDAKHQGRNRVCVGRTESAGQ